MENDAIPVYFIRVTSWLQPPLFLAPLIQRVYLSDSATYNIVICYTWRRMRYDRGMGEASNLPFGHIWEKVDGR